MVKSKKGFTLMEVLVVVFISTLLITMVAASIIYISKTTAKLIQEAEEIEMARNIEHYFREVYESGNVDLDYNIKFDETNGNIMSGTTAIFSYTDLEYFNIYLDNDEFFKCDIIFNSGRKFEFIIGLYGANK